MAFPQTHVADALVVRRTFLEFAAPQPIRRTLSAPCLAVRLEAADGQAEVDGDRAQAPEARATCKRQESRQTTPSDASTDTSEQLEGGTDGDVVAGCPNVPLYQPGASSCVAEVWSCPAIDDCHSAVWTTVMLRNLPNDYSREMVIARIDREGFFGRYDFLYLPIDFTSGIARGFAFINLLTPDDVQAFTNVFSGFCRWSFPGWLFPSKKVAEVAWSRMQGFEVNVEGYRNSSVMHPAVPDKFKPVVFRHGHRVAFPLPSRLIQFPNGLAWAQQADTGASRVGFAEHQSELPAEWTTLMIRNLPNDLTRCMLLSLLNRHGFEGCYNFVYLPVDFRTGSGKGFAFVNVVSAQIAELFRRHFTGFSGWTLPSRKVAEVLWSSPNQGLAVHVQRYRNSAVMHERVPDDFKPILFREGIRVEFPPPTREIRAP